MTLAPHAHFPRAQVPGSAGVNFSLIGWLNCSRKDRGGEKGFVGETPAP